LEALNLNIKKKIFSIFCLFSVGIYGMNSLVVLALESTQISAPSAILMEASTGKILFDKDSHQVRNSASLVHIITMLLAMETIKNGKLSMTDKLTASQAACGVGGAHVWLRENEKMPVNDLLKAVAIASANDAAMALAENISGSAVAFAEEMNDKAKTLGCTETTFRSCICRDEDGNDTSAHDIAQISKELLKYPEILKFTTTKVDSIRRGETQIVSNNKLLKGYKGISGLKTGTNLTAGSCICATAKRDELELIAVVLGAKSPTERFDDARSLLDFGFAKYGMAKPKEMEESLSPVRVLGGMKNSVDAASSDLSSYILVPKGRENEIKSEVEICEQIEAPVFLGQNLGKIVYKLDSEVICECPVTAAENVEKIGFGAVLSVLWGAFIRGYL
jgi:D-alanyl-D-alanine carboxypeptidase (penicillin-binding protein 5/6)